MPLSEYEEKLMRSLKPPFVAHHEWYVNTPHPVRDPHHSTTSVWPWVTCPVCFHALDRAHPEQLGALQKLFKLGKEAFGRG